MAWGKFNESRQSKDRVILSAFYWEIFNWEKYVPEMIILDALMGILFIFSPNLGFYSIIRDY